LGHGGYGGHYGHGGASFRPILPLLFYPMMGYWLFARQGYALLPAQGPGVNFTAIFCFNLERGTSGIITAQTIVREETSILELANMLEVFLQQIHFRKLIAINVDGREIYRQDLSLEEQLSKPKDNLEEGFTELKKTSNGESVSVVTYSVSSIFRYTLNVSFATTHLASRCSVELSLAATPQVYFVHTNESAQGAVARIERFNQMMLNPYDRTAFVIQERDFLIPTLQNVFTLFATMFKVRTGNIRLYEGMATTPIWRSALAPSQNVQILL
jgi:hypothetical protein